MNLLRCHILGFGKLAHVDLTFDRGLNLVYACNEGGKSTLQHFLLSLLYGQLRAGVKNQRRPDSWAERFKPWHGSEYGGFLWCELAGGRQLEVHRFFGKEENQTRIRTITGEDITAKYDQQKNGDLLFAKAHLGMAKDLFESVAVIRENKVAVLDSPDTIRDRVANLAQTGDEDLSIRESLQKLQDAIDAVGSDRAPTKPFRQAQDRLHSLEEEKKALESRRGQFQMWSEEKNMYGEEVSRFEQELYAARGRLAMARWNDTVRTVQSIEEIEKEISGVRREIQSLIVNDRLSLTTLEELDKLLGARAGLEQRLEEVRSSIQPAVVQLQQVEAERRKLTLYEKLDPDLEAEKITEDLVRFESLSRQQQEGQQSLASVHREITSIEQELRQLGPAVQDAEVDWQSRARRAAEEDRFASEQGTALAEKISQRKIALSRALRRSRLCKGTGALSLILTLLVPLCAPLFVEGDATVIIALYGIALVLAIVSFTSFLAASRSKRSSHAIEQEVRGMEEEQTRYREAGHEAYREIREAMAACNCHTVDQFLILAKQSDHLRQALAQLKFRSRGLEIELEKSSLEAAEIHARLEDSMAKVGMSCSEGDLATQADVMKKNLRRYRELSADYQISLHTVNSLRKEEARLGEELNRSAARVRTILAEAEVESPEAFREGCRVQEHALRLRQRMDLLTREHQRLCRNLSLEQWQERLRELEGQLSGSPRLSESASGLEEAEREEKEVALRLASARENYARLVERVDQAFRDCRTPSEIEEDLAVAQQTLEKLAMTREALTLALQTLRSLSREQQEVLAPQLNRAVERRFLRVCRARYHEVKIDPDFHVRVREAATGELRSAENLSRGTQDQLYFALRFGILDLLSNSDEPCPCLLDEPFAAYDRTRVAEAYKIVKEEAGQRQMILFTCREDLRDLALREGARVIELL